VTGDDSSEGGQLDVCRIPAAAEAKGSGRLRKSLKQIGAATTKSKMEFHGVLDFGECDVIEDMEEVSFLSVKSSIPLDYCAVSFCWFGFTSWCWHSLGWLMQELTVVAVDEVFDIAVQQNKKHSSFRLVAVITAPLPVVVVTREHGSTDLLPGLATQFMEYQTAGQGQSYF
jgi:hypothetical protein